MHSKFGVFLLCLLFLIPTFADSAVFPTGPNLTVGNRVFTDLSNLIVLVGRTAGSAATTFRKPNGSAGYLTAAAGGINICAVQCFGNTAGTATWYYNTTDAGINGSAGAGPVYFGGASTQISGLPTGVSTWTLNFNVIQSNYFSVLNTAGDLFCTAYAYEAHDCTK